MDNSAPENLLFILFENYLVKTFHCHAVEKGQRDTYKLEDYWSTSLPSEWRKDKENLSLLVDLIVNESVKHFKLDKQNYKVEIVTDNADLRDLSLAYAINIVAQKDFALIPYFASSYFSSFSVNYSYLDYYSSLWLDNHGNEKIVEWEDWKDISELVVKNFKDNEPASNINLWLNQLIRPVISKNSFFLSSLGYLFENETSPTIDVTSPESVSIIAGGEMFSWMISRDTILPFLSIKNPPSFYRLYHDRQNVLFMNKAVKKYSLKLLERMASTSLIHTADVFTPKLRKIRKKPDIIGKVTLHDEDGHKTLYPVYDDILVVPVVGKGSVTFDLEPEYFMEETSIKQCQDLIVIDGRQHDRDNILNMRGWYERINSK